jgi:hypothetical protein
MAPLIMPATRTKIRLNVFGTHGFQSASMPGYVFEEIPRSFRVVRDDGKREISLPHVLTQCDKRFTDVLLGNCGTPERVCF